MCAVVVLFLLASFSASSESSKPSVPVFFFGDSSAPNLGTRFIAETPTLRATFDKDSVIFQTSSNPVSLRFQGADSQTHIDAGEPMPGRVNFLLGQNAGMWRSQIPLYRKIMYRGLYQGVALTYSGAGSRLKSEFTIAPGADPNRIRLEYTGGHLSIEKSGDLVIRSSGADLREAAPEIYQESPQGRVRIPGEFRLFNRHTAGFKIGRYDVSKPLVIDPVISYSSYLGGGGMGAVDGVAVDGSGNLYVTGWTEAPNFPVVGPVQPASRGGVDAFVAKLNPSGSQLLYATYIGGSGTDQGSAIAVDSLGEAYVTGFTQSPNFPLASAAQRTLAGGRNAFVVKLNAAGNALVYSTYLGGSTWDQGTAIAVDGSGDAYIGGDTQSPNFPSLNAVQAPFGGNQDAFVTKLNPAGALLFSTFLGGSNAEHAGGIAVDSSGNVYVAGATWSTNFPVVSAIQSTNAGGETVFVAKINSGDTAFVYSTYLGGSGSAMFPQQANAIALDKAGDAFVAGVTNSPNFPTSANALRTTYNGWQDSFVTAISASGALVYSTYLGGSSWNWASAIAVDGRGNAYVVGSTTSVDFPVFNAGGDALTGGQNAFVSELNPPGNGLIYSTYYGGSGTDVANSIALDSSENIYVGGATNSSNFPLQSPFQSTYPGSETGWVLRLKASPPPNLIWVNDVSSAAVIWYEAGAGGNVESGYGWLTEAGVPGWTLAGTGDFNNDGVPDLVWMNQTTRQAVIWYMGGPGGTQEQSWAWLNDYSWISGWHIGAVADFNGDGVPDVVWLNDTTRQATVWYMGGTNGSVRQSWSWVSSSGVPGWSIKGAADFNGDGVPDLIWVNDSTRQALVWYMTGEGGSQHSTYGWISSGGVPGWNIAGAGDFNGDGSPDVIWVNDASQQAVVWYLSGSGGVTYDSYAWISMYGVPGWNLVVAP